MKVRIINLFPEQHQADPASDLFQFKGKKFSRLFQGSGSEIHEICPETFVYFSVSIHCNCILAQVLFEFSHLHIQNSPTFL